jgi:hypothetical protein
MNIYLLPLETTFLATNGVTVYSHLQNEHLLQPDRHAI